MEDPYNQDQGAVKSENCKGGAGGVLVLVIYTIRLRMHALGVCGWRSRRQETCDRFFHWVWTSVGEPLAENNGELSAFLHEADDAEHLAEQIGMLARDGFTEWIVCNGHPMLTAAGSGPENQLETRRLPHCNFMDLYDQLVAWCVNCKSDCEVPSLGSMLRVWHETWRHSICIRHPGQHSRCAACAKYTEYRKCAPNEDKLSMPLLSHCCNCFFMSLSTV